ncbi:hypothetical protein FE257_009330 [Aspergillus nanangensis]|uniref:DNL-type domain-containing protein n=1 Tax=Aspergillus nanangensis TaxID=2582783 RepID=A0AAD4CK99_ASPNN|nr:hypothetical protein FE257_009330 [Aspergillus nanangensis]
MRSSISQSLSKGLRPVHTSLSRTAVSPSNRPFSQLTQRWVRPSPPFSPKCRQIPVSVFAVRYNSGASNPLTDRTPNAATDAENEEKNRQRREQEPAYQITFTCKPCGNRSSHRMSKHGYHRGTVLIRCPSCENRHVISDHLKIFYNEKKTLEDILSEQGNKLTRGYTNGDMEFWDDGTVTQKSGESSPETTEGSDSGKGRLP